MKTTRVLLTLSILIVANGLSQPAAEELGATFTVDLPCTENNWGWFGESCVDEEILIPSDRPIYALLVSGFHQNKQLDLFHFYNFAEYLQERGAYVHYAWWNNLLAPYMEKPLHNVDSVPSQGAIPLHDSVGFVYGWPLGCLDGCYPNKAIPAEDYQFQKDATAFLTAVRQHNPDAIIILVGHSMGGDAVVRLADQLPGTFDIDLLAPIDPVGNRTCVQNYDGAGVSTLTATCNGFFTFTRWRATHEDWMTNTGVCPLCAYDPPRRTYGSNIKYLYHRWQQEFGPPYDYSCPAGGMDVYWPCASAYPEESNYLFGHPADRKWSIPETHTGATNVQAQVDTELFSGKDVPVVGSNFAGGVDGHGEIVGFRGALLGNAFFGVVDWVLYVLADLSRMFSFESYPLALKAGVGWPSRDTEQNLNDEDDPTRVRRVQILKAWETDPSYLYKNGFEPWNPGLCMVSRDLSNALDTIIGPPDTQVNQPPVADAGADQTVSVGPDCSVTVTLDGSDSYDEDGDDLTYSWLLDGAEIATGVSPTIQLSLGVHAIELVVSDGHESSLPDRVDITAEDTIAPELGVSVDPAILWPPDHRMVSVTALIQTSDSCDESPTVELVSITSNKTDHGVGVGDTNDIQGAILGTDDREFLLRAERAGQRSGRIYTISYEARDSSGNVANASAQVTVPHDRGRVTRR